MTENIPSSTTTTQAAARAPASSFQVQTTTSHPATEQNLDNIQGTPPLRIARQPDPGVARHQCWSIRQFPS
ncbi:unnamed protein product [Cochlearia groenlandica]